MKVIIVSTLDGEIPIAEVDTWSSEIDQLASYKLCRKLTGITRIGNRGLIQKVMKYSSLEWEKTSVN